MLTTFSPSDVKFILGSWVMTGWNEISVDFNSETYRQEAGIGGKNTRVRMYDESGVIRVTLPQTSISNDIFSTILELDKLHNTAVMRITLEDRSGNSVFRTNNAYISGDPSYSYANDLREVVWEIVFDEYEANKLSGNKRPTNIFERLSDLF